jgi:hypothetical protein
MIMRLASKGEQWRSALQKSALSGGRCLAQSGKAQRHKEKLKNRGSALRLCAFARDIFLHRIPAENQYLLCKAIAF